MFSAASPFAPSFVPDPAILLPFALASFVLAVTPGPDMALYVGRAISDGRGAGLACFAGCATGILIHTLLVALGLSALLVAAPRLFFGLKLAGAAYLLWLAFATLRYGSSFTPAGGERRARSWWAHFLAGLGMNLLNPKVVLFFLTFLPQFVVASDPNAPAKLVFLGLFFLVVAVPTILPMIFGAEAFSRFLQTRPRVMRGLDWLLAGVFGGFAISVLRVAAR